jgi:protein ImuA
MNTSITRSGIEELRERVRRLEDAAGRRRLVLPFGIKAIDRHLPGGGLALGALHEVAGGGHDAIDGAAAALNGRIADADSVNPGSRVSGVLFPDV